jgi:hypothetical protein
LEKFTQTFFGNNDVVKWEKETAQNSKNFVIELLRSHITMIDETFFNSEKRKRKYFAKDKRPRSIVTYFGVLTYTRRRYRCRHSKRYFCLIDELLGVAPYSRATVEVKEELLRLISEDGLSYHKASSKFHLSKTFVYKLLKNLNTANVVTELPNKIDASYLHIVADEYHILLQDKSLRKNKNVDENGFSTNNYIIKHVTLFTDMVKVSKGRNELVNRVMLTPFPNETHEEFCLRVNSFIYNNYNIQNEPYLYGDGANWITSLASELGAKFILSDFNLIFLVEN